MSDTALNEYTEARSQQLDQNEARRIRTKVEAALGDVVKSGRRWPSELLQNAQDAGPREGAHRVDVTFSWDGVNLEVSHTGKPFTPQELAALLSGGSSKGYDDEETTGRFGTGFLVTHAISPHVDVEGVIETSSGLEVFCVPLRRDGDENSIVKNIGDAREALSQAVATPFHADTATVRLTYQAANAVVVAYGLDRLREVLPYLYATCPHLGRATVRQLDREDTFEPGGAASKQSAVHVVEQTVTHSGPDGIRRFAVLRATDGQDDRAAALVLVEDGDSGRALVSPADEFPRAFVRLPIAGTHFLPFDLVIDGQFTPQQERDGLLLGADDRTLVERALSVVPALVLEGVEAGWDGAERLANLAPPERAFSTEPGSDELEWWVQTVSAVATEVARLPVVETAAGRLPAITGRGDRACFVVAAPDADGDPTPAHLPALHGLVDRVHGLHPVVLDLADRWEEVARQWDGLGVPVLRVGLGEVAAHVKGAGVDLGTLPVAGDPVDWLVDFLDVAFELEAEGQPLLRGLIPNQHGHLCNPAVLRRDSGVPEVVKDALELVGDDIRSELLHSGFAQAAVARESARRTLDGIVPDRVTEHAAVRRLLDKLRDLLPDETESEEGDGQALRASAALAAHLVPGTDEFREIPFAFADGSLNRVKRSVYHLAPVSAWPPEQQPFEGLYPPDRVLHPDYAGGGPLHAALAPAVEAGLVVQAPLFVGARWEVDGRLLAHLTSSGDSTDAVLRRGEFEQIALLPQVLVQRCSSDPLLAGLLLDFVLEVASKGTAWRRTRRAVAFRDAAPTDLQVYDALWPAELAVRQWISVEGDDGPVSVPTSKATLDPLLTTERLRGNAEAVAFLTERFGFSELDLLLKGIGEGAERAALESQLATLSRVGPAALAELAGADDETILEIAAQLARKRGQDELKEHNRQFGLAVQNAVEAAVGAYGLALKFIDSGYDYEVSPTETFGPDGTSLTFEAGPYLLEVKATTTGEVHLTPKQAWTAGTKPGQFVLCVVDLRDVPRGRLLEPWAAQDVEGRARIVRVSEEVGVVVDPVLEHSGPGAGVRLRNEGLLRYAVPPSIWEGGASIRDWVGGILAVPHTDAPAGPPGMPL